MDNRPKGREKNVTGAGKGVYKRGEGLGTGKVGSTPSRPGVSKPGSSGSNQQRPGPTGEDRSSPSRGTTRASGGKVGLIAVLAALLLGGGGGLSAFLGGGGGNTPTPSPSPSPSPSPIVTPSPSPSPSAVDLSSLLGSFGGVSTGWGSTSATSTDISSSYSNVGKLNTSVAPGSRAKYTTIRGNGKDVVTILVYMCGTDLESGSGMGTSDLQEMINATIGSNVNLLVYTGGCKQWRNNVVSSSTNQIYKIESGGLRCMVQDAGDKAMTSPSTLAEFLQYGKQTYPKTDRFCLIFWDHGGGSLSGYGYDEKHKTSSSMTLTGIDQALKAADMKFDFIGFDACLMATTETAFMLTPYADYLIASEETEPGVGWYYTNWLTNLSANTSVPTLEIGKNIVDDFVAECARKCRGQTTTLSVVDLAELETTAPAALKSFATSTSKLIENNNFSAVSNARSNAREFAADSRIDQVDLIHLARNLNTTESNALASTLLSAVKYNRTSSDITNAYGLSIYFPYKKTSKVDSAVATYAAIGMDDEYSRCIQQFASMEVGGQTVSGGSYSALSSLLTGSSGSSSAAGSSDMITEMLTQMLSGNLINVSGLNSGNTGFFGRSLGVEETSAYLSANRFDPSALVWNTLGGTPVMTLPAEQWMLVNDLELNVFYDDGEGYLDLGLDNLFDFTDDGSLIGEFDNTWLAIDDQVIAYYHTATVYDGDNYTISGYVPVLLNGQRAELLIVFDNENPYGAIVGARTTYHEGETETVAKSMTSLTPGDTIDFLCDYYTYEGEYSDTYYLGEPHVYTGNEVISNVYLDEDGTAAQAAYLFTDIYGQQYWAPAIP